MQSSASTNKTKYSSQKIKYQVAPYVLQSPVVQKSTVFLRRTLSPSTQISTGMQSPITIMSSYMNNNDQNQYQNQNLPQITNIIEQGLNHSRSYSISQFRNTNGFNSPTVIVSHNCSPSKPSKNRDRKESTQSYISKNESVNNFKEAITDLQTNQKEQNQVNNRLFQEKSHIYEETIKDLKNEVSDHKKQLEISRLHLIQAQQEDYQVQNLKDLNQRLKEQVVDLNGEMHKKKSQIEELKLEVQNNEFYKNECSKLQLHISEKQSELDKLRQSYSNLQFEFENSKEETQLGKQKIENLNGKIQKLNENHIKEIQKQEEISEIQVNQQKTEISQLNEKIRLLKKDIDSTQDRVKEINQLNSILSENKLEVEKQLQEAKEQEQKQENQIKLKSSEISNLKLRVQDFEKIEQEVLNLNEIINSLNSRLAEKDDQVQHYKEQYMQQKDEIQQRQLQLSQKDEQLANLIKDLSKISTEAIEREQNMHKQHEQQLQKQELRHSQLTENKENELQLIQEQNLRAQEKIDELLNLVRNLEHDHENFKVSNSSKLLKSELNKYKTMYINDVEENSRLRREIEKLNQDKRKMGQENRNSLKEIYETKLNVEKSKGEVYGQIAHLEKELEIQRREKKVLIQQINSLSRQMDSNSNQQEGNFKCSSCRFHSKNYYKLKKVDSNQFVDGSTQDYSSPIARSP